MLNKLLFLFIFLNVCGRTRLLVRPLTLPPQPFQVFFVIRLIAGPTANSLPPISDPDGLMACDLMDGRDAFLTLARDKHLEFSSLRRSLWSSMCMLVELHNQSQDRFVYTCNECKHHVETRYHCTVCEVRRRRVPPTPGRPPAGSPRSAFWGVAEE